MTLAIDCRELIPGRVTGIGRLLRSLLDELARRPAASAVAIGHPDSEVPQEAPHIRIHRIPECATLWWDQVALPRALRRLEVDVFFSPYYKAPLFAPCPTIVTIHDLIPVSFLAYASGRHLPRAWAFRLWAAILARRAAAVVTDSEFSRRDILAHLRLRTERVHVVPIGAGSEFYAGIPRRNVEAVMDRYGISSPYLLSVGNFLPHKNLMRLVEAFDSLSAPFRNSAHLVLAGTAGNLGPIHPVPREALARTGVHFPGFIPTEDLPALYAGAIALVCPSLVEGFGLPVLEAMACGTPVVCARAGSLPEVAGDAALYVDPTDVSSIRDGLARVLADPALREDLSARGARRAQQFSGAATAARLADLIEAVAVGGPGRRRTTTPARPGP